MRLEEIGCEHRRYHPRAEQGKQHLDRDCYAELFEELARNRRHEARGDEHRNDRQADGDDRKADLVGRLERSLIGRFAHPDMPHDVFDLDDGVIDEDSGAEGDRQQGHHVQREAEQLHDPEGWKDRQRQGDRRDDGRPPIAQKEKNHDHCEDGALVQRMHRRFVVSQRMNDRCVDQLEVDSRVGRLDGLDASSNCICEDDIACALRAQNIEADDRRTVESRKGPGLRNRIGDEPQIVQPHLAARRQRDPRRREIGNRLGAGEGADGLVASANLGAPTGEIHVTPAKLAADIERRQADRLEPNRIEPDPDLALHASDAIDPRDPANSLQCPYDHVIHEPGELLRRFSGCYRGVGEDRKPGNVDPLDHRLVDAAREIGADARHRVLDVIERAIRVRLQPERDRRAGYSIGDDGVDVVGAGDPGDGILHGLRDPRLELRGCGPELRDGDRDDGNVDIRHARHRQLGEADVAECDDCRRHDERRERVPYRPRRDVNRHQRPPA